MEESQTECREEREREEMEKGRERVGP